MKLRKRSPFNYYEVKEPSFDEYVYCDKCADFVYEYCSIHGALLVIPDDKVPAHSNYPPFVPRAALTIPKVFLHIAHSIIPGAGLGVFSTLTIPRGVRFGPYHGVETTDVDSLYCWQLHGEDRTRTGVVDASDANASNWMRYVNCARHWCEQNLVAYQYQGQIYYRTIKIIPRFTELLVFYGGEYARLLDVNLKQYDNVEYYTKIKEQSIMEVRIQKQYIADTEEIQMCENTVLDETVNSTNALYTTEVDQRNCNTDIVDHDIIDENKSNEDDLIHPDLDSSLTVSSPTVQYDQTKQTYRIDFKSYTFLNSSENTSNFDTYNNNFCYNYNFTSHVNYKLNQSMEQMYFNDQLRLKCQLCPFTAKFKEHLQIDPVHLNELTEINGSKVGDRTCELCTFKSMYTRNLYRHMKKVHGQNGDQTPESVKKQSTNEHTHKCQICSFTTNNNKNVRRHMNRVHRIHAQTSKCTVEPDTTENCLKCPLCAFTTNLRENIRRHIRRQHSCNNRQISEVMKLHASSVGLRYCHVCSFTSEYDASIRRHITDIHSNGVKKYKCTYCDYQSNHRSKWNQHVNRHTKKFTFICDLCSHIVYNRNDLVAHIRRHHKVPTAN